MGKHHSADERARIIAAVRAGLKDGISIKATAQRLGITEGAFYRWVREESRAGGHVNAVRGERARAVDAVRQHHAEGKSMKDAAGELGLSVGTFYRWAQECDEPTAVVTMRAVTIVADAPPSPAPAAMPPPLSLVAPSGHRVEGLTIEAAAALLRALA